MQCSNNIILSILLLGTSFFESETTHTREGAILFTTKTCNLYDLFSVFEGSVDYRITEESLKDRLSIDMHDAYLQIDKECRCGKNCLILCLSFTVSPFHLHYKSFVAKIYTVGLVNGEGSSVLIQKHASAKYELYKGKNFGSLKNLS
jgi:hypothetical protein